MIWINRMAVGSACALALVGAGALLAGCGGQSTVTPSDATAPQADATATTPRTAEIAVGKTATLEFPVNTSTGYVWRTAGGSAIADGIVRNTGGGIEEPDAPVQTTGTTTSPAVGVPGRQTYTYEGVKAGSGELVFELVPPGTTNTSPAETRTVTITVTG